MAGVHLPVRTWTGPQLSESLVRRACTSMSLSDAPGRVPIGGDLPPPPKARRLSWKQPVATVRAPPALLPLVPDMWLDLPQEVFEAMGHRKQYRSLYNKFWYWFQSDPPVAFPPGSLCTAELWALARSHYDTLNRYQKNMLLRYFFEFMHAPEFLCSFACRQWKMSKDEKEAPAFSIDAMTLLLTYQGEWGVVACPTLSTLTSDDELAKDVRQLPEVVDVCRRFDEHGSALANKAYAGHFAWSVEICLKTWRKENLLRLHGHLFIKSNEGRMRCGDRSLLTFEGCVPHHTNFVFNRQAKGWAGAYYTLAPKLGSVQTGGSLERNVDFPVNPDWVFNLVQACKMGYENARTEIIRCVKHCERNLKDLDCWFKNKQQAALQQLVAQRQMEVRRDLVPFPSWMVVNEWMAEVARPVQSRKRVLVLSGPSRTGKQNLCDACFHLGPCLSLIARLSRRFV